MSGTFSVALSGMLAQGDKMSVIGNNIANSQTIGFKSSRLDFSEEFITHNGQFINGTHNQLGNGVRQGGVTSDWSNGANDATGNPANLAISGDGFFVVKYEEQEYYSRAGDFALVNNPNEDEGGFVLMRPNGAILQGGQGVTADGYVSYPNGLGPVRFRNRVTGETAAPDSYEITPSGEVVAFPDRTWESVPSGYESIKNLYDYQEWLTKYRTVQEIDLGKAGYYLPGFTGTSSWRATEDVEQTSVSISNYLTGGGTITGDNGDGVVHLGYSADGGFVVSDNNGLGISDSTNLTDGLTSSELFSAYQAWEDTYNVGGGEYTPGIIVQWNAEDSADVPGNGGQSAITPPGGSWDYPKDILTGATGGGGQIVNIDMYHAWKLDYQAANGSDAYVPGIYKGKDDLFYLREWNPVRDYSFPMEVPEATTYSTTENGPFGPTASTVIHSSYEKPTQDNVTGANVRDYDAARDYLGTKPENTTVQMLVGYSAPTNENLEVNTFDNRDWDPNGDYALSTDDDTTNDPSDLPGIEDYVPPTDDNLVAGIEVINGQIPIVRFNNPDSLERIEGGMFRTTTLTSITAGYIEPSKHGSGTVMQGFLEGSNVDLTIEFTEMIQVQRAFQANGKTITTADEMLQTVMGLKR
jgi:flagellar hook protein FlgE